MLDFIDHFDYWSELIQEGQCDVDFMTQEKTHRGLRSCPEGSIIIYAIGSTGDVLPMIGLAAEFLKRGYRVKVFTLTKWQSLLARLGIEYFEHDHPIMYTDSGYDPKYNESILEYSGTLKGARVLLEAFTPMIQYLLFSVKKATKNSRLVILSGSSMSLMDSVSFFMDSSRLVGILAHSLWTLVFTAMVSNWGISTPIIRNTLVNKTGPKKQSFSCKHSTFSLSSGKHTNS
jgi:hypothetical protein